MSNKSCQKEKDKYQRISFICVIERQNRNTLYGTVTNPGLWIIKLSLLDGDSEGGRGKGKVG